MARMIDADALIEWFRPYLHIDEPIPANVVIEAIRCMPTLTQPNEPLTFIERREMDRKPVWLDDEKAFGILQFWDDNNVNAVFLDPSGCIRVKSVIGKKIYRRSPEEEDS